MPSFLDSVIRLSSEMVERGLLGMDSALRGVQSAVGRMAGQERSGRASRAPLDGPPDIDTATADFANRVVRATRSLPRDPAGLLGLPLELMDSARRSFAFGDRGDPVHWMTLLAQLPASFGTLAIQETLRGLIAARSVPPRLLPDFVDFVVEIFSDLHVYFSLQYREELNRQIERVRRHPGDAWARLELGRTYTKCGLFRQAAEEFSIAAEHRSSRRRALYEKMVAEYHSGRYREAMQDGIACLKLDPTDEQARYWLWLSARKSGGYSAEVPRAMRLEVRDGYAPTSVEFDEVAEQIGLDKTSGGRGTAVFDFDGDGHLDIVVAGAHSGCSLFRNNGDGTFTDVSTGSGLDRCVYAFAVAAGDYDNNGRPDLFISSLGFYNGQGRLFRNNGDGTFTDVTEEAGVDCWGPGFVANWVDYDCDGHLDLFVVNNLGGLFDRKTPNRLFRNRGDGTFADVTEEAGLRTLWPSLGAAWGDFNNNGRPDLFVSNLGPSQLFRNNGDGSFTDVSREAGVDHPCVGSVALCCDIDQDGWLDIVQLTYSRPRDAIHTLQHGSTPPNGTPLRIYRNNRDGTFTSISREMGIRGCWGTMSGNVGDFNNDGHLDLMLGNGDPRMDRNEASVLLENDGKHFRNVTFSAGLPYTGKGHGVNMADLGGDGRLHLIVGAGGLYPGDLQTTTVFRPRQRPGNYLNVRLVGTRSNRDAIGSRLALTAGGRTRHMLVSGGSGFGCLPCEQHFGLGHIEAIDTLEVRWPSGLDQRFDDLPINATVQLTEGNPRPEKLRG